MVGVKALVFSALLAVSVAAEEYDPNKKECGPGIGKCPENKPCCSQYGQCGLGAYCLGGCDPMHSKSINSCMPAPVCKSGTHTFKNLNRIKKNTEYLGDASKADWVSQGELAVMDDNLFLTMPRDSVGSLLSSTTYMWYGKVSAKMRTSRGQGVVTAFILMSDVKDEIDYEWVGVDLKTSQTNYYFEGITDYRNSRNITSDRDTFNNYHTYEVDWTPDQITWSIDGQVGRVKKRSETYNATTGQYMFPQTPSRVQLSLWPGGKETNGKGTIDWAGGPMLWNGPEFEDGGPGYYYAMIESIKMECYDPPSDANIKGSNAYVYTSKTKADNSTVAITDDKTVMKSFIANGEDPDAGNSDDATTSEDNVETIPGMTGAGFGTNDKGRGEAADGTVPGNTGAKSDTDGFSQGGDSQGKTNEAGKERVVRGSMLAVFIAIVAMGIL